MLVGFPGITQHRIESELGFLYESQAGDQTPVLPTGLAQVGLGWSAERKPQLGFWIGFSCPGPLGLTE